MPRIPFDRRRRRSQQAQQALHFQLERVRDDAALDALVLATEEGLPVAHSGEDELCTELAALAPFYRADHGESPDRRVRAVSICAGSPLYLVFYNRDAPPEVDGWVEHTHRGIARILAV